MGDYRKIQIICEGDKLFMIYDTYVRTQLLPETVDNYTDNRNRHVKFLCDSNGLVTAIQVKHSHEFKEVFRRQ